MQPLDAYDISPDRGFLCKFDASTVAVSGDLAQARSIALRLPEMLPSGRVRSLLRDGLAPLNVEDEIAASDEATARMAMVHYAFMVQAYIWGEEQPSERLPAWLARPITLLADRLGQMPLLSYSGYVLDNWDRLDSKRGLELDNLRMLQNFLSGQDEAWFVLIHVAIEAEAGQALARMAPLISAAAGKDSETARALLEEMAEVWQRINAHFDRMPERCDPYIYFERVRPYIHGWKDNPALPRGVAYEGVGADGSWAFRGQTGSQSSIVPSMDAVLGVGHAHDPMKAYLDELHVYRPPAHRAFIDDLRSESGVREVVRSANHSGLRDAYNANIQAVADFRSRHLEYAATYINKQGRAAAGNDTEVGTGGTPFMRYLKKHRDETRERMIAA